MRPPHEQTDGRAVMTLPDFLTVGVAMPGTKSIYPSVILRLELEVSWLESLPGMDLSPLAKLLRVHYGYV